MKRRFPSTSSKMMVERVENTYCHVHSLNIVWQQMKAAWVNHELKAHAFTELFKTGIEFPTDDLKK